MAESSFFVIMFFIAKNHNKGETRHGPYTTTHWGVKSYQMEKNGKVWDKVKAWFGFKLHLIVDANPMTS